MRLKIIPLLILTLALTACYSADRADRLDHCAVGLELVVRAAAGRALDLHPEWIEPTRRITGAALADLAGEQTITVAALEQSVVARIAWDKLSPEEQALAHTLIGTVCEALHNHLARSGIEAPDAVKVRLARVLKWINQTAELRGGYGLQGRVGVADEVSK